MCRRFSKSCLIFLLVKRLAFVRVELVPFVLPGTTNEGWRFLLAYVTFLTWTAAFGNDSSGRHICVSNTLHHFVSLGPRYGVFVECRDCVCGHSFTLCERADT
mmetsp:Transcript_16923/g.36800  ORF Transcript_16923/g.36800 Transcript_16923/m.36800 type:complete len:103 (+) Transcript_16923:453-761(+)